MPMSSGANKRRVFVVEDHALVREGMIRLIDDEEDLVVCGQAESADEAARLISECRPDIALVDLSLKQSSGFDLIEQLRKEMPHLPVLVLSMHDEMVHAERALRVGARGYIMKQEPPDQLMDAIRLVLAGQICLSTEMSSRLLSRMNDRRTNAEKTPLERLTTREVEVYDLIGSGKTSSEIAERLGLSVKTIDAHRENIKRKLGLKTAAELIRHAVQHTESL